MQWKLIKLEHAPVPAFPDGSAVRGYMLRLPLTQDSFIDGHEHALNPHRCTMRRFWPSERDQSGYVAHTGSRWELVATDGADDHHVIGWFENSIFANNAIVEIAEADKGVTPFLIASIVPA